MLCGLVSVAITIVIFSSACLAQATAPAIHYPIFRRGGVFAWQITANFTFLAEELSRAEARYNATHREMKGNKVVRMPKASTMDNGITQRLMAQPGEPGIWFTRAFLGDPAQWVDFDLNMLTTDTYLKTTSSDLGTPFNVFFSTSYQPSLDSPFPSCRYISEKVWLPVVQQRQQLKLTHCSPRLQSLDTLSANGGVFGLAPSPSLSQFENVDSLLQQLVKLDIIQHQLISVTLLNSEEGLLSIGGSIAHVMTDINEGVDKMFKGEDLDPQPEMVLDTSKQDAVDAVNGASNEFLGVAKGVSQANTGETGGSAPENLVPRDDTEQTPNEPLKLLKRSSDAAEGTTHMLAKRDDFGKSHRGQRFQPQAEAKWRDSWMWSPVQGAAGWWQTLLRGIWINQVKSMKNQPVIVDINTPFILAPPLAVKQFYAAVPGAYRLPAPHSNFWAYPCNNPPSIDLEFGGWRFPVMRGAKNDLEHRGYNQRFSLGMISPNSGYCVGAVVETRMGVGDTNSVRNTNNRQHAAIMGEEPGILAGNGLRGVWILGEPAFRGLGLMFDFETKEIGFRKY